VQFFRSYTSLQDPPPQASEVGKRNYGENSGLCGCGGSSSGSCAQCGEPNQISGFAQPKPSMHTKQKQGGAERSSNKPNLRKIIPLELTQSRVPMQDQARSGSKAPPSSNLKLGKAPKQRREQHGDRGSRLNPLFFLNSLPLKVSSATQAVYYSARLTATSDSPHMAPGKRRRRDSSEGRIAKWIMEFEDSQAFSFLCDREKWRGIRVMRSESNRVRSRKFPSRRTCRCETERRHGRGGDDRGRMQGREGIAVEYLRRG
jgi:hypothetical protein